MSLWTPGGEHPVDRPGPDGPADGLADRASPRDLAAEEQAQLEAMQAEMEEVQAQLLAAPASLVVVNHAMGIYELAALHLMQPEPKLAEASLAIDALGALVDGLEGRLGEDERRSGRRSCSCGPPTWRCVPPEGDKGTPRRSIPSHTVR